MVKEQRRQHGETLPRGDRDEETPVPHGDEADGQRAKPRQPPYEKWTRETLYAHARSRRIAGRSSMSKQQLIDALRRT